ncbi:MAG: glycosyltransferase family 2 protein [Acidimicrobiales bacterium]
MSCEGTGSGPGLTAGSDIVSSSRWDGPTPLIAVVVSTYGRAEYLQDLLAALNAQDLGRDDFEIVIVDNGSEGQTWSVLSALVSDSENRIRAVRLEANRGPGGGRNAGVAHARARYVAFTDDDCLPTSGWLRALLGVLSTGATVVQGWVDPDPQGLRGPWDHTVHVGGITPWFETSNVAYERASFVAVGGFDEKDALTSRPGGGRAFGEDALLGWKVVAAGGTRAFSSDALVFHRVIPATYRKLLGEWRHLAGFPGLVRRSGIARDSLRWGIFLNQDTARFDLAVGGVALAVAGHPEAVILALPWARRRWTTLRGYRRGTLPTLCLLARQAGVEAVGLGSLVEGSVRHRRLVL